MSITKTIRLSGSSPDSLEDAVHVVIARAAITIADINHWTLVKAGGKVDSSGAPTDFEVTLDITFTVKESVDHG